MGRKRKEVRAPQPGLWGGRAGSRDGAAGDVPGANPAGPARPLPRDAALFWGGNGGFAAPGFSPFPRFAPYAFKSLFSLAPPRKANGAGQGM